MWLGIVVKKFKASIWKAVSGRSLWVWVLHGLHNEFKAVQEYTERSYLKKKTKWKQKQHFHFYFPERDREGSQRASHYKKSYLQIISVEGGTVSLLWEYGWL